MKKIAITTISVLALLVACQSPTSSSSASSGPTYLSAPAVGSPAGLADTGANGLAQGNGYATFNSVMTAFFNEISASSPGAGAVHPLVLTDRLTGHKFTVPSSLIQGVVARSAGARSVVVSGSKTPVTSTYDLLDSTSTKVGTYSSSVAQYAEYSDAFAADYNGSLAYYGKSYTNGYHSYYNSDETGTLAGYSTGTGAGAVTLTQGKMIVKGLFDFYDSMGFDSSGEQNSGVYNGTLDQAIGYAVSGKVTQPDGTTVVGGKFLVSVAAHQVFTAFDYFTSQTAPSITFTVTIKGYDDNDVLQYSEDKSATVSFD